MNDFLERMRCVPRILAHRNRQLGSPFSPEELDDLAQEVLTRIWDRVDTFRGDATIESWAYRFCSLVLLDTIRSRRLREASTLDGMETRAQEVESSARLDHDRVHAALAEIPPNEALVVRRKLFEGQSFDTLAAQLGISPNTAKTRYYRALGRLRRNLAELGDEEAEA